MNDKKWWQIWKSEETQPIQLEVIEEDLSPKEGDLEKSYALKPHDLSNMMMLDGGGGPGYFFDDASDRQFDYATLDKLSRHNIASAIVQTRINQVSEFSNPTEENSQDPIGFRIKKRDGSLPNDEEHAKIKELERFVSDCGYETIDFELTFESFLRQIVRDSLVYDQCNFEIVKNKAGKVVGFVPVDASTIRRAKGSDEYKYVQIRGNKVITEFKQDELCFGVRRPRTSLGVKKYGFPELEELYQTLNHIYNAETYNAANFTNGISAAGIIAVKSKMNPKLFRAFRREFYQMLTGTHNSKKTPLIQLDPDNNEDLKALNLSASNAEMEYSNWINYLIKVTCAIYQMDPAEIGFVFGNESQRSSAVQSDPSTRVLMGKEKGLRPLLRAIQSWINKYVIYQIDPDYTFEFIGMDAVSALDKQRIQKGRSLYMTINELRALSGLAEIEGGDIIADAYTKIQAERIKDEARPVAGVQKDYDVDAEDYFDYEEYDLSYFDEEDNGDSLDKKKRDEKRTKLTQKEKEAREKEKERRRKLDKPVYKPLPGDENVETKPSKYTRTKLAEKVREEMKKPGKDEFIRAASKVSGVSKKIIEQVYDRGLAAWAGSHRPGATAPQWAKARVYSFLTGGKTRQTADKDLWEKHKENKKKSVAEEKNLFLDAMNKHSDDVYNIFKAEFSEKELEAEIDRVKKIEWDFSYLDSIDWDNFDDDKAIFEVPEIIQNIAKEIIKLREEKPDEVKGGTRVGWTRARQLADGDKLSLNIIQRMYSFWVRHKRNAGVSPENRDTPWKDNGWTAIQIWGGHEAGIWTEKLLYKLDSYLNKDNKDTENKN